MHLPGFKPEPETKEAAQPDVEVRIRGLMMDPSTKMPIVVLNDLAGEVVLPIWVGLFEANAIALEIEKATTPRPMTHDLLRNVIHGLNARVTRVVVGALREDTFHATIWMDQGGEVVALDARPSDAIALALRSAAPSSSASNSSNTRGKQAVAQPHWPQKTSAAGSKTSTMMKWADIRCSRHEPLQNVTRLIRIPRQTRQLM